MVKVSRKVSKFFKQIYIAKASSNSFTNNNGFLLSRVYHSYKITFQFVSSCFDPVFSTPVLN